MILRTFELGAAADLMRCIVNLIMSTYVFKHRESLHGSPTPGATECKMPSAGAVLTNDIRFSQLTPLRLVSAGASQDGGVVRRFDFYLVHEEARQGVHRGIGAFVVLEGPFEVMPLNFV